VPQYANTQIFTLCLLKVSNSGQRLTWDWETASTFFFLSLPLWVIHLCIANCLLWLFNRFNG